MKTEELRRACEVAGLIFHPGNARAHVPDFWVAPKSESAATTYGGFDGNFGWEESDPALPAYVASLLVAKVRERGLDAKYHVQLCDFRISGIDHVEYWASATDEQRIRAAMEVLTYIRATATAREWIFPKEGRP